MSYLNNINLYDADTDTGMFIDMLATLRIGESKRLFGSYFGSNIDTTYQYTTTPVNGGAATASNGVATLATNTTANGSITLMSKTKGRTLSGRVTLFRCSARFGDTGTANNVREIGIYVDANNMFVFRLSGTTFSVLVKKAGVETVVNSGSWNGNGQQSSQGFTVDTNFHIFEIAYVSSRIQFFIDGVAKHSFRATTTTLVSTIVGFAYLNNTNSGGSTANVVLDTSAISCTHLGSAINNPLFYNVDAIAETRTLKSAPGTLQSLSIGRLGGANALITLYDSTTGSGTKIATFDLTANSAFGTHVFGLEGVNFNNGLTYVTSGTMTNGSVTIFWE